MHDERPDPGFPRFYDLGFTIMVRLRKQYQINQGQKSGQTKEDNINRYVRVDIATITG